MQKNGHESSAARKSSSASDHVHVELGPSSNSKDESSSADPDESIEPDELLSKVPAERQVLITWRGVDVYVPIFKAKKSPLKNPGELVPSCLRPAGDHASQRQVLFNARGAARPGQFMALMGPSGSGKTTLVSVIGGRAANNMVSEGDVLFNGEPLSRKIKRDIGFVLQDDLLFESLTVQETLLYAARLRLPRTISLAEKRERVDSVINALGLGKVKGTLVGGPTRRGISGGERKRVSVAHELLIDPAVLILDEPTSGLDSTTAMNLVRALRGLASGGRTLITTIHQPSSRLYQQLDQLILMSEGHVMFSGRGAEAARWFGHLGCRLPYGVNVADFVLDLASGVFEEDTVLGATGADRQQRLIGAMEHLLEHVEDGFQGEQDLHHVSDIKVTSPDALPPPQDKVEPSESRRIFTSDEPAKKHKRGDDKPQRIGANYAEQLVVLTMRSARTRRFEALGYLKFCQFIAVAIIAGLLWLQRANGSTLIAGQDTAAACFFELLFLSFGLLFSSLFVFPVEIRMLLKERTSDMYRLSAYYIARSAASLPLDLAYPSMFIIIMYWMAGLRQNGWWFLANWLTVLLVGLVGQSIGYIFGAGFGSLQQAQTAATVSMLTFVLCSGFWIKGIPSWLEWVKYLSFVYWGYDVVLKYQFHGTTLQQCNDESDPDCTLEGSEISDALNLPRDVEETPWIDIGILFGMLVVLRYAVYLVLRYKTRNT